MFFSPFPALRCITSWNLIAAQLRCQVRSYHGLRPIASPARSKNERPSRTLDQASTITLYPPPTSEDSLHELTVSSQVQWTFHPFCKFKNLSTRALQVVRSSVSFILKKKREGPCPSVRKKGPCFVHRLPEEKALDWSSHGTALTWD
jgi:hypothetical protein